MDVVQFNLGLCRVFPVRRYRECVRRYVDLYHIIRVVGACGRKSVSLSNCVKRCSIVLAYDLPFAHNGPSYDRNEALKKIGHGYLAHKAQALTVWLAGDGQVEFLCKRTYFGLKHAAYGEKRTREVGLSQPVE